MTTTTSLFDLVVQQPRQSLWSKFKRWCLEKYEEIPSSHAFSSFCCCVDSSELELYRLDNKVRGAMRENFRAHMGYSARESCVGNAIDVVLAETGYDLGDLGTYRKANAGIRRTYAQWDQYFAVRGVDLSSIQSDAGPARVVPKFAAACALHIRVKLGVLANNEANVLLVQRKYLEICRKHGVRDVDTVLHQQFVMNAVFTEGVLDEVASVRRRLPQWIKWLDSLKPASAITPTIC